MNYNPKTKELEGKVEVFNVGTAQRIMNSIIWGNPEGNPFKHLSDKVDLSPNDPVFRGEPYDNPDNTPH
jgi:hypothetical protein